MGDTINYQNSIIVTHKNELAKCKTENNMQERLKDNDRRTRYYTGLPSYAIYYSLFLELEPYFPENLKFNKVDIFLLTLLRLRLGCHYTDLAYRFNISIKTASHYFHNCLDIMNDKMRSMIIWPQKDQVRRTMALHL